MHRQHNGIDDWREISQPFPAILSSTIVLRGQRATIPIEWAQARNAVHLARQQHLPLVLLPAVDDMPLEAVGVGMLVNIEGESADDRPDERIAVYGREAVTVALVPHPTLIMVTATPRILWRGDDPRWVGEVEELGVVVRRRAQRVSRNYVHTTRSYEALGLQQLVAEVASWLLPESADRYRLLEADLLGQVRIVDAALTKQLKGGRSNSPRRRHKKADPPAEEADTALPEAVKLAIAEERSRGSRGIDNSGEQAARFLEGMQWVAPEPIPIDLVAARASLDAGCYGMETVKASVLDFLAASEWSRRKGKGASGSGKVICLLGPPGVGKTSIAAVIAQAMGRGLIRMPMGGVDDVFLAGADQSYRAARPGEIARRIRQSDRHPSELVFLLDEIDKVLDKIHSAIPVLLALLDREQQAHFRDHFLDAVSIDLSKSLFICTANNLDDISPPLLDRLQPLVLPGYSRDEQVVIGSMHLLPRLRKRLGIDNEVELASAVIPALVDGSAASPGMRQLQAQLETVLTRGLRLRIETERRVFVTAEDALKWTTPGGANHRQIGFRAPTRSVQGDATEVGVKLRGVPLRRIAIGVGRTVP